jgi:hypothetical protein
VWTGALARSCSGTNDFGRSSAESGLEWSSDSGKAFIAPQAAAQPLRSIRSPFDILTFVRMIWWFLIVLVAAGAVVWAALSAYVRVRQGLTKAENRPPEHEHHESEHDL